MNTIDLKEFEDDLNFDMFDITTGNVISCDKSPMYDSTIRWNSSINATLEKSIHESTYQKQEVSSNNIGYLQQSITGISQIINDSSLKQQTPVIALNQLNIREETSNLNVDINHKHCGKLSDFVECKDMNPIAKVSQLQPYVTEIFDVSCVRFYACIIESDFWSGVSKEMGFLEMNEGTWKESPEQCHQERLLQFKTPISFKIGPKVASVSQTQKVRRTPSNGYFMETSSISRDVPYGDNFSVENYISLEPHGLDKSILKVSTAVKFTKSIWGLTSLIEKTVIQSNKDFFQLWSSMAKKRIQEEKEKLLQPTSVQPIQPIQSIQSIQPIQTLSPPPMYNIPKKSPNNININNNNEIQKNIEYEEMKKIFYQLYKEVQEQGYQHPRVIKVISVLSNQHIANVTIQYKHSISDLVQYLLPFTLPNLHPSQYFEIFWLDKKNEFSQFFYKDMNQPVFNFVNNSDSIGICTVTEFQALKKALSFVIIESGKKASIKYNQALDKCSF